MTAKKALSILDWWINQKKQGIRELATKWDYVEDSKGVAKILLHSEQTIISNLERVRKELVPNCNHPMKMRDKAQDGKWYCMNCNFDL